MRNILSRQEAWGILPTTSPLDAFVKEEFDSKAGLASFRKNRFGAFTLCVPKDLQSCTVRAFTRDYPTMQKVTPLAPLSVGNLLAENLASFRKNDLVLRFRFPAPLQLFQLL